MLTLNFGSDKPKLLNLLTNPKTSSHAIYEVVTYQEKDSFWSKAYYRLSGFLPPSAQDRKEAEELRFAAFAHLHSLFKIANWEQRKILNQKVRGVLYRKCLMSVKTTREENNLVSLLRLARHHKVALTGFNPEAQDNGDSLKFYLGTNANNPISKYLDNEKYLQSWLRKQF